jgi:hypothetical protein
VSEIHRCPLPCPVCRDANTKVRTHCYQDQLNPYDGREPMGLHDEASCGNKRCWMSGIWIPVKQWNRRAAAPDDGKQAPAEWYAVRYALIQHLAELVRLTQPDGAKVKWRETLIEREAVVKIVMKMKDAIDSLPMLPPVAPDDGKGQPKGVTLYYQGSYGLKVTESPVNNPQSCYVSYTDYLAVLNAAPQGWQQGAARKIYALADSRSDQGRFVTPEEMEAILKRHAGGA